jgi:hypothetical protein
VRRGPVRVPISAIILTIGRVERRQAIGDQARDDVDARDASSAWTTAPP